MELQDILDGLGDFQKLQQAIVATKYVPPVMADGAVTQYPEPYGLIERQWYPQYHHINNPAFRPNKLVRVPDPSDPKGKDMIAKEVKVSRLALPMQKMIVNYAKAFLCGNPIELSASPKGSIETSLYEMVKKTWEDNKLDYESKKLAGLMMAETECAELWFSEKVDADYWKGTPNEGSEYKLRMRILANKYGDKLYPIFDAYGDMVAFGRSYFTKEKAGYFLKTTTSVEHFDLYTDAYTYKSVRQGSVFLPPVQEVNPSGKIPVIYYNQEVPEWYDVQSLIDRLEVLLSNLADTNDYFGKPKLAISGKANGFFEKGETGEVYQLENGAKMDVIAPPNASDSIKMEIENLLHNIYLLTQTPRLSEEQVKGLGNYSGIALKMLFQPAHMKAADHEETFGKGVQRRLNFIKTALTVINKTLAPALTLNIKPKFTFYTPQNTVEDLQNLIQAVSGSTPLMSHETAVKMNPLLEDGEAEWEKIQDEQKQADSNPLGLNNAMGGFKVVKSNDNATKPPIDNAA